MQPSSRSLLPIVIINIICVADITDTKTKLIDSGPAPIPHLKFDYLRFLYYEICYNIGTGTIIWNDSFVISKGENKLFVPNFTRKSFLKIGFQGCRYWIRFRPNSADPIGSRYSTLVDLHRVQLCLCLVLKVILPFLSLICSDCVIHIMIYLLCFPP